MTAKIWKIYGDKFTFSSADGPGVVEFNLRIEDAPEWLSVTG